MQLAPLTHAFWVDHPRLLAGGYPTDVGPGAETGRLSALISAGVRAFADLTHPGDVGPDGRPLDSYTPLAEAAARKLGVSVTCVRFPITDESAPDEPRMVEILDRLDALLSDAGCVYVHCWAGRGRTGTVVGCWLARHGVAQGAEVLETLRRLRRREGRLDLPCPAEEEQRTLVRRWRRGQ